MWAPIWAIIRECSTKMTWNRLLEVLSGIKGKFMLTMYPHDLIREYAGRVGWTIRPVQRTVTASNTKRRKQEEWMITNY